jgi:hypothetical protein
MQILKVEPWNEAHGVFACHMLLEPWEDHTQLANVIARSYDLETMKTKVAVLIKAMDELDAYKKVPALVNKGEDRALRNRS